MHHKQMLAVAAVAVISLLVVRNRTNATPVPTTAVQSWEHLAMDVPGDKLSTPEISRKIIGLGNDGWELVDVETMTKAGATSKLIYFFKRPRQ